MHLQKAVLPHDYFIRCIGLGAQVHCVKYDPDAPLHERYVPGEADITDKERRKLEDITLLINAFFNWDFNSCESLRQNGEWYPIDFANPCPDSQITSLNWHFPWMVGANIRWSVFAAATGRKMSMNQNWAPYFKIADRDLSYEEKLAEYAKLARKHFEVERFEEFCAKHLSHVDDVIREFFTSQKARDAVHEKVTALFPAHEVEKFTQHFWDHIQNWVKGK